MNYADQIVDWYLKIKRDVPWRKKSDAYSIWVSEIMLQQTKVDTVIPYYIRFIDRFPDVFSLAQADKEEVYTYWQGLGYYRRCDNLHKGAKYVVEHYNGVFPKVKELALKIPGIGPYTVGAILSIAYNIPIPAVDGNVMRILSRQFVIDADIQKSSSRKVFEQKVMELMPNCPNIFNQALMELGALVCTPKVGKVGVCPMQNHCFAYALDDVYKYPINTKKTKVIEKMYRVLIFKKDDLIWMQKRADTGLLANTYGFPMLEECEYELIEDLNYYIGPTIQHVFSHRIWNMEIILIDSKYIKQLEIDGQWIKITDLNNYPIATAFKKVLNEIV